MNIKVEANDDIDESAIDDLCDQHGDDDADSNDGGLAESHLAMISSGCLRCWRQWGR